MPRLRGKALDHDTTNSALTALALPPSTGKGAEVDVLHAVKSRPI